MPSKARKIVICFIIIVSGVCSGGYHILLLHTLCAYMQYKNWRRYGSYCHEYKDASRQFVDLFCQKPKSQADKLTRLHRYGSLVCTYIIM